MNIFDILIDHANEGSELNGAGQDGDDDLCDAGGDVDGHRQLGNIFALLLELNYAPSHVQYGLDHFIQHSKHLPTNDFCQPNTPFSFFFWSINTVTNGHTLCYT